MGKTFHNAITPRNLIGAFLALSLLVSCGSEGSSSADQAEGQTQTEASGPVKTDLKVRIGSDIVSFDPHGQRTIDSMSVQAHLFSSLLDYDYETGELVGALAEDWTVSDDLLTYEFTLRKDALFQDGSPVTADDVVFTVERIKDPELASPLAVEYENVESVSALDSTTVQFEMAKPNANFLYTLTPSQYGAILPKAVLTEKGDAFWQAPIGSGPYKFGSRTPGQSVTLERFNDYYGTPAGFESIEFRVIPEESVAETALKNGEIDIFWNLTDSQVITDLENSPEITVQNKPSYLTCDIMLNQTQAPFDDPRVRQAAAYGMDTQALVDDYFDGRRLAALTPLSSSYPEFTDDVARYNYDPERSKQLLKEAGYEPGEAKFVFNALAQPYNEFPVLLIENLKEAGFDASLNALERGEFSQQRSTGELQTVFICPAANANPDSILRSMFHSDSFPPGFNTMRYEDVDDLLDLAQSDPDATQRKQYYAEVQQRIMTDVPAVPLYTDVFYQAYGKSVTNVALPAIFFYDNRGVQPAS